MAFHLYCVRGIILLWAFLLCIIIQVSRFSVISAAFFIHYLVGTSFAAYFNYTIIVMNP
ncbi:MAG: hypothetical protein WCF90_02255 [Methanomicrobiales archaeon]